MFELEHVERAMSEFDSKYVRSRLFDYLKGLSDIEYQRKWWVNKQFPHGAYDDFEETIKFFFDGSLLCTKISAYLGNVLQNEEEVEAIQSVCNILDKIYFRKDWETDADVIELPEWQQVINFAKGALVVLNRSEKI